MFRNDRWGIGHTRFVAALAALFSCCAARAAVVTLPIELVGENASKSVTFEVTAQAAREALSLWLQIHGLAYRDMAAVQINSGEWTPLNNETVTVAEPGRSFGGIGGGFSTLKMTLALPAGAVVEGENTIRFRFHYTAGVASGFRVLAFNLLSSASKPLLSADLFAEDDPRQWAAPLTDAESIRMGRQLWRNAPLSTGGFKSAPAMEARCADCHAYDGRDLKYFNFSNSSIVARAQFHGLSAIEGRQIASYIRSLPLPNPGRPWNPPYQPGPGLDAQPAANWAAGAGLAWTLDDDSATLPFLFGARAPAELLPRITREAFRPDGNLNPREIPIELQLPDWNHWLPQVHPMDAWGPAFQKSEFAQWYGSPFESKAAGGGKPSLRRLLASPDLAAAIASGRIVTYFDKWRDARRSFLKTYVEGKSVNWTPELGTKAYATQLWQLVKTWEMTQEFGLEERGRELYGPAGEPRTWFNTIAEAAAPATANIPDGPSGMGGSALTNEYFDAAWYQLQVIVNAGNHRHRDRQPVDWVYLVGSYLDLYRESKRPEPARLLIAVVKAMQSADPRAGPENASQGWQPRQNVDPTIMVSAAWDSIFQPLESEVRRAVTESLLAAWLDKNMQFPLARYFTPGLSAASYASPEGYGGISGGKAWESAPLFRAAGVSPEVVGKLEKWGRDYHDMAARFQYSDSGTRKKAVGKKGGGK